MNGTPVVQASAAQPTVRLGAVGISKSYGPVRANADVSISVAPQQIHAVVGENGAGKSTLMRIFQGIERPDDGKIIVDDVEARFAQPQQAFALGIGMVHQDFMLAPDLTLLENLVLGDEPVTARLGPVSRIDWAAARRSGDALAGETGIRIDWDRRAGSAPVHVQQFVEIIRLLRRGTRILILDEPTAVLAPQQVEDLFRLLRGLRRNGTTILFISHKLKEVMALADRVTVIRRGRVSYSAEVADTDAATVAAHIVGGEGVGRIEPVRRARAPAPDGGAVFCVNGLVVPSIDKSHPLHGVDMAIDKGEIVGLAGVSGNGQDELVESLVGLRPPESGSVKLNDTDITYLANNRRRALGIGYVSADRGHEGLATGASVEANATAGSHRRPPISNGPFLRLAELRRVARDRLAALGVRYGALNDPASSLSGGNQQRLVFAREIAADPSVLVVAQPTRGVDLGGIAAIHDILCAFRDRGGSVFLVSEELEELLALADRILVMAGGRIVGETKAEDADLARIGRLMVMQGHAHG